MRTYWQPAGNDLHPSWTVDLERFVAISGVRLTFTGTAAYRVLIEVSDDQKDWHPLANLTNDGRVSGTIEAMAPANTSGRFVRLRFPSASPRAPVRLAEVEVTGKPSNR